MKKLLIIIFSILSFISKSQTIELKNKKLIKYYELINDAEKKIINNELINANHLYKEAFKEFTFPHAKDLHTSMKVALNINDSKFAYDNYQSLKCLGENSVDIFKDDEKYNVKSCENKIDIKLKKNLDSLFNIDQYYRKLSKGNYSAFKKELTKSDSIASVNLLQLIQNKGFPNEYDIGLEMNSEVYFHDFYLIIWHQLASNLYSPQIVNFSNEINKALNAGKIRPDIAGFLLDLNNSTSDYSYFKIYQFISDNENADCCYVNKDFLYENRTEKSLSKIQDVNYKRKLLGLSSTEDEIRKSIFSLKNKEYIFSNNVIEGWNFTDPKDAEKFKSLMIKLNDTDH